MNIQLLCYPLRNEALTVKTCLRRKVTRDSMAELGAEHKVTMSIVSMLILDPSVATGRWLFALLVLHFSTYAYLKGCLKSVDTYWQFGI